MDLSPQLFSKRYHKMLEPRPRKYHIATKSDEGWGVEITQPHIAGISVWHEFRDQTITLGVKTPEMRQRLPRGAVPPGATFEMSQKGWFMYRWPVGYVDLARPPEDQAAMTQAVELVKAAFDWYREARIDINKLG